MMLTYYLVSSGQSVIDGTAVLSFIAIILAAATLIGAPVLYWIGAKRRNSGKIETSDAATLWQQSESMRRSLEEQLRRTEDQRDRVIDLFQEQMLPSLAAVNKNQGILTDSVTEVLTLLRASGPLPGSRKDDTS